MASLANSAFALVLYVTKATPRLLKSLTENFINNCLKHGLMRFFSYLSLKVQIVQIDDGQRFLYRRS